MKKKFKIIDDDVELQEKYKIEKEQEKIKTQKLLEEYVKTLDSFQLEALEIAKNSLGSSFDLEKSIGFIEFKNQQLNKS